ncbi:hypothetical protein [Hymenobacter metallicola]|uniref:Uncharacterized protein n=1 Tax=Hymenobacter metallicola TaxID=2563114 RepID=A0A4Z0Q0J5_9BACT|nr:hypothetical protein [Hymenobacter metallicola]TGE23550.1 hypothetical protein E5K02_20405 [Hymenobacter metallicola]
MKNLLATLLVPIHRLQAEMPTFWRRAQKLALFGLGVIAALKLEPELVPDVVMGYLKYAFVFFTTVAGTAQFTCKDASQENSENPS